MVVAPTRRTWRADSCSMENRVEIRIADHGPCPVWALVGQFRRPVGNVYVHCFLNRPSGLCEPASAQQPLTVAAKAVSSQQLFCPTILEEGQKHSVQKHSATRRRVHSTLNSATRLIARSACKKCLDSRHGPCRPTCGSPRSPPTPEASLQHWLRGSTRRRPSSRTCRSCVVSARLWRRRWRLWSRSWLHSRTGLKVCLVACLPSLSLFVG